jgi:hypothetical protein
MGVGSWELGGSEFREYWQFGGVRERSKRLKLYYDWIG